MTLRSPEETATWLQYILASYEQLGLGSLAVLRKEDGALIGRCGLMDLVVESTGPAHGIRRGWFGRERAPVGVALTFECELGYTFDPAVWGQGFATEAARCVRDYARDVLKLPYAISAIVPENVRSRRVAERSGAHAAGQMDIVGLTWDRWVWPLGWYLSMFFVLPGDQGRGVGRALLERALAYGEARRAGQCFGVILPAKVWLTIFPSFTTKVSVPSS